MNCRACGADVPDGASYCLRCGVNVETGQRAGGDAPDASVYPLLAKANLCRMRGNWVTAEQKAVEVLRLYPNNATAHSLLGDIYADQERWEEALQWYQLAVDLDPNNKADRRRLEQVRQTLAAASPPKSVPKGDAPAVTIPSTDDLPEDSPKGVTGVMRRMSPPVQLAIIALLSFSAVLMLITLKPRVRERPLGNEQGVGVALPGGRGFTGSASAPTPSAPTNPAPPASGERRAGTQAPGGDMPPPPPAAPANNTPAAPSNAPAAAAPLVPPSADMTEAEARTLARVQTEASRLSANGQARVADLRWDPVGRRALVTVVFGRGQSVDVLRDEALRGAYRVGQSLSRNSIDRFEIIVKAPLRQNQGPEIAFAAVAEGVRPGAWILDPALAPPESLLTAFAHLWWHRQLQ